MPTFFKRKFADEFELYSALNIAVIVICGGGSAFFGGYLVSSKLFQNMHFKFFLLIPSVSFIISIPFMYLCLSNSLISFSLIGLSLSYLFAECWWSPTIKHLFSLPSKEGDHKGLFFGIWIASCGLIGNSGSLMTAFLEEHFQLSLGTALLAVVSGSYILSSLVYLAAIIRS
jgi:hypothetical protein